MPTAMKSFEALFAELKDKVERKDPQSGTVRQLQNGVHAIGKKVIEEACEVWMAAEHEGQERTAEEISQLLYHVQVMMIACELGLEDVYRYL
jgi:phosphoribosyl-ATP pyrophosphohydrolase